MEVFGYLLKVVLSLGVVILIIAFVLPLLMRKYAGLPFHRGEGSFSVKKVQPIMKDAAIVEIEIKGKIVVLVVTKNNAEVIYRDDGDNNNSAPGRGSSSTG